MKLDKFLLCMVGSMYMPLIYSASDANLACFVIHAAPCSLCIESDLFALYISDMGMRIN